MIYLDNAATTPPRAEVLDTFRQANEQFWANPHALHRPGVRAEQLLEQARTQLCRLLDAEQHQAVFTSGATESINLALKGAAHLRRARGLHIITSNAEHPATSETLAWLETQGFAITALPVGPDGTVTPQQLGEALREDTILVSLIAVNNESGSINPIDALADSLRHHQALFHVDAVQAVGKLPLSLRSTPVDLLSLSAHKFGGLKGSGALLIRQGIELPPQLHGGGQEGGLRSGTADVPRAAALAKALRLALDDAPAALERTRQLATRLREGLSRIPGVQLNSPATGSPYILNASIAGIPPETLLHGLSEQDIHISTVSACSSRRAKASHVILAMTGDAHRASHTIRISLSPHSSESDVQAFLSAIHPLIDSLR